MKQLYWIGFCCSFLLLGLAGCNTIIGNLNSTTLTATVVAATSPEQLVKLYYTAVEAQNYPLAYRYLDANATDANGQKVTLSRFEQMAQADDIDEGKVISFSAYSNPPMVTMTNARAHIAAYHAHLRVHQEGAQGWKITALDGI